MDAQQLLAEFGHIAIAPGGVGRLREMVLALAVSGRLIERPEINKSLAADFLRKLEQELADYKAANKYRRTSRDRDAASMLKIPAPAGWINARLGQIGVLIRGVTYNKAVARASNGQGMTGLLRANNIGAKVSFDGLVYVPSDLVDKEQILCAGDVLIAMSSGSKDLVGKAAIILKDSEFGFGAFCGAFRPMPSLRREFIRVVMQSPQYRDYVSDQGKGIGINNLTKGHIEDYEFFLPPPEEQTRIVAKVDELMALCDRLEAQQQARRKLQNNLRQATLQAVASATSPHELQTTWARLADNFGRLFHAQEDVDDLRKTVLDLAVSGYLSNLDALDEPASILKRKILAAKKRGIADGSFSRKKHVKPEELAETILPAHWESITLDEAISTIDAGWSPACLPSARDDESKWGVLKTTAVQVLRFLPHEHKELPASLNPRPQYQIEVGDILITRAGPKNRVGICCVVDAAPPKLMISDKLIRFHIVDDLINPRFVALCLSAGEPGRIVERLKSGMADSQMNISQDKLRSITIPLPPIEEQQRILTKIEAFMKVVDVYSERLRKRHRLAEHVAAAAVSSLTGIAIEQEEEPMKAPQTELLAPLRLGAAPDIKAQAPLATILTRHHGEMSAKDLWQRFGGEIDAFYAQLKTEVAHGWILEPAPAEMREKPADVVSA